MTDYLDYFECLGDGCDSHDLVGDDFYCKRCWPMQKEWLRLHEKHNGNRDAMMWDALTQLCWPWGTK